MLNPSLNFVDKGCTSQLSSEALQVTAVDTFLRRQVGFKFAAENPRRGAEAENDQEQHFSLGNAASTFDKHNYE
jgi:hypothetical protein